MDNAQEAVNSFNQDFLKRVKSAERQDELEDFYLLGRVFEGHHKRGVMLDWAAFGKAIDEKFGSGTSDGLKRGIQARLDRYGLSQPERNIEDFMREMILKMKREGLL